MTLRYILMLLCSAILVFGQQIPSTKGVAVHASATSFSGAGVLQYDYQLSNPQSNSGSIWLFNVDIAQPAASVQFDGSGLPSYPSFLADVTTVVQSNVRAIKAMSATAEAPPGWFASLSNDGSVTWGAGNIDIAPGQTLQGYQIFSRGLPAVRSYSAQPYIDVALLNVKPPSGDPADSTRYKTDLDAAMNGNITQGFTIGPGSPLSPFVPSAFLLAIQGYEQQAVSFGWVKGVPTANALAARISTAKSFLSKGDMASTSTALQGLLDDVGASQTGGNITSEAFALLTYNVQYLMANLQAQPIALPAAVSVTSASGAGSVNSLTFIFSDPRGAGDLGILDILVNNGLDAKSACYVAYINSSSTLALVNDAGAAGGPFAGAVVLGSQNVISNSQCSVSLISAVPNGTTLTLKLGLTMNSSFAGSRIVFAAARDQVENNSGWQPLGVWQVPPGTQNGPILVTGMSPPRWDGTAGTAQTYTLTWTDTKGVSDLGILNILVNNGLDAHSACYLAYIATGNAKTLVLVDDGGNAGGPFAGTLTMGSPQLIQNSQCIVNGAASSAVLNGTGVTLNLNIAFKAPFSGNRIVYLAGRDSNSLNNTGWWAMGTVGVQ